MVWNKIKDVFATPTEQSALEGVRAGKAILAGTIRSGDDSLTSPIHGYSCVAFFYRATWVAKTADSETQRVYREAECYAPGFWLAMEDAELQVIPKRTEPFTAQDHLDLLAADIPHLQPAEQLVREGDRVRLHGRLHTDGDEPWFELGRIDILEARPLTGMESNRRGRRKKRREDRRASKKRTGRSRGKRR